MKKLNKLEINPEKLMKNVELISLRGGYEGSWTCDYWCEVHLWDGTVAFAGVACGLSAFGVQTDCNNQWGSMGHCHCI